MFLPIYPEPTPVQNRFFGRKTLPHGGLPHK